MSLKPLILLTALCLVLLSVLTTAAPSNCLSKCFGATKGQISATIPKSIDMMTKKVKEGAIAVGAKICIPCRDVPIESTPTTSDESAAAVAADTRSASATVIEVTPAPDAQSVSAPDAQSVSAPDAQSVSAPDAQSVSAPDAQSVSAPDAQSVSAPDAQSASAPVTTTSTETSTASTSLPVSIPTPETDPTPGPQPGPLKYSIGYYASWTRSRLCHQLEPEKIDARAYTHIMFAFAIINEKFELAFNDDTDRDYFERLVNHVHGNYKGTKVVISVGGFTFNDGPPTHTRFTEMVESQTNRQTFIQSTLALLKTYQADGIDLDWLYPTASDRGGRPGDANNYVALVREMREAFSHTYSISVASPVGGSWYFNGLNLKDMAPYLDFILALTYDLHGTWEYTAADGGQMQAHTDIRDVKRGIQSTIDAGVPREKILLGLAFYGRVYKQLDPEQSDIGSPFVDPNVARADPGKCTQEVGPLSYNEIVDILELTPETVRVYKFDNPTQTNILAFGSDQWLTFDNSHTILARIRYAKEARLGGTSVWTLDQDDRQQTLSKYIRWSRAN